MKPWINAFCEARIATGCGFNLLICRPASPVAREEMAVLILRARQGAGCIPPGASHNFLEYSVAREERMETWIDELYTEWPTSGCATNPLR